MKKRWRAIINRTHRFRAVLASWAARIGLLYHNKINVRMTAFLHRILKMFSRSIFSIGFKIFLRRKGRMQSNLNVDVDLAAKVLAIKRLKHLCGFAAGLYTFVKKRVRQRFFPVINIGFISFFFRKRLIKMPNLFNVKAGLLLGRKGNVKILPLAGLIFISLLRRKRTLLLRTGFISEIYSLIRRKRYLKYRSSTVINFISHSVRKRINIYEGNLPVRFSSTNKKKGRLSFDNRKGTIYTLTLLKNLTIGKLKDRNVSKWKYEWRIMPQFRTEFAANLRKQEDI